jgi:WD40 repeat protein
LRVWDWRNDKIVFSSTKEGKDWREGNIAFSPDGKYLAAGGGYHGMFRKHETNKVPIVLYDLKSGEVAAHLWGHSAGVFSLSFSDNGDILLSCGTDGSVRIWDVRKRQQTVCIEKSKRYIRATLSPDGRLAAIYDDKSNHVELWDARTGKRERQISTEYVHMAHLVFSTDSKRLAGASDYPGSVRIWDVATGADALPMPGHRRAVASISFSPDGKILVSQGLDRTVRFWDVARGEEIHQATSGEVGFMETFAPRVSFSQDGSMVTGTATDWFDPKVRVWGTARGNLRGEWSIPDKCAKASAFLPDGKTLVALGMYGRVQLWSVPGGQKKSSFTLASDRPGAQYLNLAVSPDGRTLVTSQASPGESPAGRLLPALLRVSDYTTGRTLVEIKAPGRGALELAYSPDGRILASGGVSWPGCANSPGTIYLWEAATGLPLGTIGKTAAVRHIAFSPDGRLMATGGELENVVRVWNVFTGKEIAKFRGHSAPVTCLAFSPDGKRLASGSFDTTILLWDMSKLDHSLPPWKPTPKELDALAEKLQGTDGPAAFQAVARLAAAGDAAVSLLRPKLRPVPIPDQKRVARLLADLDDNSFDVREAASRELATLGRQVEPDLRKMLNDKPSAELRKRVDSLLAACDALPTTAQELRELRAVWVLEEVGTSAARKCLDELAKGAPGARLTQEAKRAVDRLQRRGAKSPAGSPPQAPAPSGARRAPAANVFPVTRNRDAGAPTVVGSLSWAVAGVNASAPGDTNTITFRLAAGPTIRVTKPLAAIRRAVTVDGWSQNKGTVGVAVEIAGGGLAGDGLTFSTGGCCLRGVAVNGFGGYGVVLNNGEGTSNAVENCYVGTDLRGTALAGNGGGILVRGPGNTIGKPRSCCVISGNAGNGITITGPAARGVVVRSCFIGLDKTGLAPLPNAGDGVAVTGGAGGCTIGGNTADDTNVITANMGNGITLDGDNNLAAADYVGTTKDGTGGFGNGKNGASVGGSGNAIGAP